MKKTLKFEYLFCILTLPALWLSFSKMTTFFADLYSIEINNLFSLIGLILTEFLIIRYRKQISRYLFKEISINSIIVFIVVFIILAFNMKTVFLNGCKHNENIFLIIGAGVLCGIFFSLLFKELIYLFSRLKTVTYSKKDFAFLLCILIILNLVAIVYCKFMKKIFVWDNAGYFTNVHKLNEIFPQTDYFISVYKSIFELDYNYVIMLPASIMCKLFGKSRLVFILSIINFYVYPFFVLIYFFGKKIFDISPLKSICIILFFPYIIFAANTGFIDIGGLIPIFIAVILYFFCNRNKYSFLIGVLLAISIYMRRWYSFFALSFIITVFLHSVTRRNIKCFLEILFSFAFILLFFTQTFVSGKLMADYKNMYVAYNLGFRTDFLIFTRYYGLVVPILISIYVLLKQIKNNKSICDETFILFQMMLMLVMFVCIQTHGQQHLALYIPLFVILMMSLLSKSNNKIVIIAMLVLSALQTVNTFIPRIQPTSIKEIENPAVIPDFSNYPPIDNNAESILEITEYMDKEIGEKGKTVCFLASSLNLNYDTLNNAEISLSVNKKSAIDREEYYFPVSDVDKRDGLSEKLFKTDYILVPSELQIHLSPEEQRVISVPYEEITSGSGVGKAYRKKDVFFTLTDGTEIYLYERIRDIEPSEIVSISKKIFIN